MKKPKINIRLSDLWRDAFRVEKNRQELASMDKLNLLRRKYRPSLPEIKDLNASNFWDEKIDEAIDYEPYDGMTSERVEIAYKFMPQDAREVFDIGAGYGYVERLLSRNSNIKIFGNDISRNAVKNLQKRFKGNFRLESIYSMRYPRLSFDVVFALEVFEHVPPSKIFKLMSDIKKLLRKNGYLILSVPTNEGLEKMKDNPNGHLRMYTKDLIEAELGLAGFEIIDIKTLYAFPNLYIIKKIISKILRNRWKPNDIIIKARSI
jgi:SAM-dependent methyltransferase